MKNLYFNGLLRVSLLFVMIFFLLASFAIKAQQQRELTQEIEDKKSQKRIALVIGNGNYTSARRLANPVNDATDIAKTLKELGFDVISGTDLNLRQMTDKVREFGDKLKVAGGVGLFYYAGHGIQVGGRNYLIPVEADIVREDEVSFNSLNLDLVLQKMATANNGLNIIILDACRNNPFARSWSRSADEGGLAQITAPTGTFIAYATSPDRTAADGTGRNGLYTTELLKFIKQPNLKIEEAFKQVTIAVDRVSNGKQVPWTSSSLRGEFYFLINESTAIKSGKEPTIQFTNEQVEKKDNSKPIKEFVTSTRGKKSGKILLVFEVTQGSVLSKEIPKLDSDFRSTIMVRILKESGISLRGIQVLSSKELKLYNKGIKNRGDEKALRKLPTALIVSVVINSMVNLPQYQGLSVSTVSGYIEVIDTDNNETIGIEKFNEVRGFGITQDQARRNALKSATEVISESFFDFIVKKSR